MKGLRSSIRWHTAWTTLTMTAWLVVAGCGSARRGVPVQPPLEASTAQVAEGQRVFMQFCNGCHPGGEAGVGVALNNKPLPGLVIHVQVRNGFGSMPAFSEEVIGDAELDALIAYLKRLRRHDG